MNARAKRVIAFAAVIVVLFVVIYSLKFIGGGHRSIDTSGDVVFASDQGSPGQTHVFIAKGDGTGLKQLTSGNEADSDPSFSSDGSQIAFVSNRSSGQQVYVMDADGAGAHAITLGSDSKSAPKFAPDDNHIAYLSRGHLIVADPDGGETQILLPIAPQRATGDQSEDTDQTKKNEALNGSVTSFEWSPNTARDGSAILAVQSVADTNSQCLTLVPLDGRDPKAVLLAPAVSATWNHDGSQFIAGVLGVALPQKRFLSALLYFGSDGTPLKQPPVAPLPSATAGPQNPTLTTDGSRIAFDIVQQSDLGIYAPQGIGMTTSSPGAAVQQVVPAPAHAPSFSPDGSDILFLGPSIGNAKVQNLYSASQSGSHVTFGEPAGNVTSAEWSPAPPKAKS